MLQAGLDEALRCGSVGAARATRKGPSLVPWLLALQAIATVSKAFNVSSLGRTKSSTEDGDRC